MRSSRERPGYDERAQLGLELTSEVLEAVRAVTGPAALLDDRALLGTQSVERLHSACQMTATPPVRESNRYAPGRKGGGPLIRFLNEKPPIRRRMPLKCS